MANRGELFDNEAACHGTDEPAAALAELIDALPDAVLLLDETERVALANPPAVHLFGCAKIELMGRALGDLVPAAERARWSAHLAADAAAPGVATRRELRVLDRRGAAVAVSVGVGVVESRGRRFTLCSLLATREVARRRGASALSEARFNEAQRIAKIGSWDWDFVNDVHWWSDELYRLIDIDASKVSRPFDVFMERVHPSDRERVAAATARLLDGEGIGPLYQRVVLPGNVERVFRGDGVSEVDEQGRPVRAYGTLQDVTEQKAIEAAFNSSDVRYREAQRLAKIGSWEWNLVTNRSWWSDELYRILEEDPATYEASFENFLRKVHPEDRQGPIQGKDMIAVGPDAYEPADVRIVLDDGREKILEQLVEVRTGDQGRPVAVVGTMHDVTERRALESQLRESESQYASTVELAPVGITHVDASGRFIWSNRRLCDMLGYTGDELTSLTIWQVSHPDDEPISHEQRAKLHSGEIDSMNLEKRYLHKSGAVVWVRITSTVRRGKDGRPLYDISIVEDVTARKLAEERVQYLATHDELSGLPNRALFGELLDHAIASARRHDRRCAVLFIDLDRFKVVNDSLGHEAGDLLLKEMAARLGNCMRKSDVVARLGGDEFVVLLEDLEDASAAADVAKKILSAVLAPVEILGHECRVTASIGIAMFPTDAEDAAALMKNADMAMYLAKEEGKNNYQFHSSGSSPFSVERLVLEAHLAHALERNEFFVQYQPKIDLATGKITGAEALLRWWNTELGSVSPAQFIPLAEDTGLIVPIGKWVLKTACEQNVEWQRRGLPEITVCVNLSPRQFKDPALIGDIKDVLEATAMAPELLELEITESMIMHNVDHAAEKAAAIKALGVRLAIDDFGTGYSSLSQLKRFPIDTLKVDRSFVRDVPENTEDMAITEAIITLGKALGVTVVAEGVETELQHAFLLSKACDEVQGYYFARSCHPDALAELLLRGTSEVTQDQVGDRGDTKTDEG
jgi:diguanylate cyclase (GGDEF)-like protein/PAS domain S-box-containing protein